FAPPAPQSEPSAEAQPGSDQTTETTSNVSGWTLNLKDVSIPEQAVSGRVHGNDFSADKIVVEGGWLKFKKGTGFLADQEVDVVPFEQDLGDKTLDIDTTEKVGTHPQSWLHWKDANDQAAQKSFTSGYAMHLEFGAADNGKIPGKIYLCLPDPDKSFI